MAYRLIYGGLGLLAVAAIVLGVALVREGESVELPGPIESVSPDPGATVIRQATLRIDLEVGYEAAIYVDGFPLPDAEFVPGTGVYSWSPHPDSAVLTDWGPGDHVVRVEWRKVSGSPDFGSFEWTFRVQ